MRFIIFVLWILFSRVPLSRGETTAKTYQTVYTKYSKRNYSADEQAKFRPNHHPDFVDKPQSNIYGMHIGHSSNNADISHQWHTEDIPIINPSNYVITTVAGNGASASATNGAVATSSSLTNPYAIYASSLGNFLIVSDSLNHRVRKIDFSTKITSVFSGDGGTTATILTGVQATSLSTPRPFGVWGDSLGNIFLAEGAIGSSKIRKIATSGIITTIAGTGATPPTATAANGDGGAATSALFNNLKLITGDSAANLYIADYSMYKIRKFTAATGFMSTVVGTGTSGSSGNDGYATTATITSPNGVFVDTTGGMFLALDTGYYVRMVDTNSIIAVFAGSGSQGSTGDGGPATAAKISAITGINGDTVGNIYVSDYFSMKVRVIQQQTSSNNNIITIFAGTGATSAFIFSGVATTVAINSPWGISLLTGSNSIFVSDTNQNVVRYIYSTATVAPTSYPTINPSSLLINTVVGNGFFGSAADGAVATSAPMNNPLGVFASTLNSNWLFVADNGHNYVRKVDLSTGITTILGGNGETAATLASGVQATAIALSRPFGIWGDSLGNVYVGENSGFKIRKITSTGIMITIIGTGVPVTAATASNGDNGAASSATLSNPAFITGDGNANIYIADAGIHKIRKFTAATTGFISTVVGTGSPGSSGDGGKATSATIYGPNGVFVDSVGNIFITQENVCSVRIVNTNNIISIFAGTGSGGFSGDGGGATSAMFYQTTGIYGDSAGSIYFGDYANSRLRMVQFGSGIISTFAGSGTLATAFVFSGAATAVPMSQPIGVHGNSVGCIYVVDRYSGVGGGIVRAIYQATVSPTSLPTVSFVPTSPPSVTPSLLPTSGPTELPTCAPTAAPSNLPTPTPTMMPTMIPTMIPTVVPSSTPSISPTIEPTVIPTIIPSSVPTSEPTIWPTCVPSVTPTTTPTITPSFQPSTTPSMSPSMAPSITPSIVPSHAPTSTPTVTPSSSPSSIPSHPPTEPPSQLPSKLPSQLPSELPSFLPSILPTVTPSVTPTITPSNTPSSAPTISPSVTPSTIPTITPSVTPSLLPSFIPSSAPTDSCNYTTTKSRIIF